MLALVYFKRNVIMYLQLGDFIDAESAAASLHLRSRIAMGTYTNEKPKTMAESTSYSNATIVTWRQLPGLALLNYCFTPGGGSQVSFSNLNLTFTAYSHGGM